MCVGGVWPQANAAVGIVHIERIPLGTPLLEVAERTAVLARKYSAKIVCDLSNQSAFAQLLAPMLGDKPHNRLICAVITGAANHAAAPVPMAISIAGKPTALPRWTLSKRELVEAMQVELENKSCACPVRATGRLCARSCRSCSVKPGSRVRCRTRPRPVNTTTS